jgi:hypothetical protein
MGETSSELENNIRKPILLILGLCFLLVYIITKIQNNSEDFLHRKYIKTKELNFAKVIIEKLPKENHIRYGRVRLGDNTKKTIPFNIYLEVGIGDSIVKLKNSDSIIYIKKNGEKIYDDINKFDRERYLEKIRN